ncbi:MAG: GDSL-type esterase/lipase family protein [Planctomycetota bacterium]
MSLLAASLAAAAALPMRTAPSDDVRAGAVEVEGRRIPYRLVVPAEIEPDRSYPLVLFLHGAGERGTNNDTQLVHFPVRMMAPERRESMPCFVLAPQCPGDQRWSTADWGSKTSSPMSVEPTVPMRGAIEALFEVVESEPVDTSRIYLTGLSMGGYGAFDLATRHPDLFAAVVPVCGGGDERQAARIAGLPISVWHGDADPAVPVERSRQMVAALRELGEEPAYHELEGVGHDAWNHAYGERGCLRWMFEQRRDPGRRLAAAARLMAEALDDTDRVAFFGDSITESGAAPGGYVDLLRAALAEHRSGVGVVAAGISGNRVPDLLAREEADVRDEGATLVFTYIGINDVWHSLSGGGTPLGEYVSGLDRLLGTLERRGGARNVVATPTLIGELPRGRNELDRMLSDYVAAARRVAAGERRTLCDLHAAFRDHVRVFREDPEADRGCLTTDGVHLNDAGNVLVATEAALAIRDAALAR